MDIQISIKISLTSLTTWMCWL